LRERVESVCLQANIDNRSQICYPIPNVIFSGKVIRDVLEMKLVFGLTHGYANNHGTTLGSINDDEKKF
jgi:hypothetical protein